jgi:hypothetical protein
MLDGVEHPGSRDQSDSARGDDRVQPDLKPRESCTYDILS